MPSAESETLRELEAIFDSSFDEIFVTDGQGVCLRVNKASERFYGLPPSALIGRNVADLEREGIFTPAVTLMVLRERRLIRMVQTTRTGRRTVVTANPVFDEQGNIIRVVANARDVTDILELKGQLQELEERYTVELAELRQEVTRLPGLVIQSPAMRRALEVVRKVADVDTTILLLGESGVGKNAIARAIHRLSTRSDGPFIEVNCGAIPETLLESELFGYESGAFTGAAKTGKPGLIEVADGGTLFLNEVGDLPAPLQVKLLHVLQERAITRVGGVRPKELDLRVIAATNHDLKLRVQEGKFRPDLFYRLNVVPLVLPPLRERQEDIPELLQQQLERLEARYGLKRRFSGAAVRLLLSYPWPGNVRELENLTERMVVTSDRELIDAAFVAETLGEAGAPPSARSTGGAIPDAGISLTQAVEELERQLIADALQRYGSTHRAAAALGISQSTVVRKAQHLGLSIQHRINDANPN
jgi:PAS domain S-box-containing protein